MITRNNNFSIWYIFSVNQVLNNKYKITTIKFYCRFCLFLLGVLIFIINDGNTTSYYYCFIIYSPLSISMNCNCSLDG